VRCWNLVLLGRQLWRRRSLRKHYECQSSCVVLAAQSSLSIHAFMN
jgi:hypothetical protein